MQPRRSNEADVPPATGLKKEPSAIPQRVSDLMTSEVVTLYPHSLFREAVDLMAEHSLHHIVVVERDRSLAGILSDRDILAAADRYDSETTLVADVMTHGPLAVAPSTSLSEVVALILERRFNCFPVVNVYRKLEGILTTTDLLRAFQKLQLLAESPAS